MRGLCNSLFWYILDVELKLVNDLGAHFIPPDKFGQVVVEEVLVHPPHGYLCCWYLSCAVEKFLQRWSQIHIIEWLSVLHSVRPSPGMGNNHDRMSDENDVFIGQMIN